MKKKIITICLLFLMAFAFTKTMQAALYSQTKTTNISLGGAKFGLSEKATFNTSGGVHWTYSDRAFRYAGGTMYPINSYVTAKTVSEISIGNKNTAIRDYTARATNQSYIDYSTTVRFTWKFDTSSNTWG